MIQLSSHRLHYLCEIIPPKLLQLNEEVFSFKFSALKWSKKEILGHLIDSASNNHQRFIRVQLEETPLIAYNPDAWNACSRYHEYNSEQLILFWKLYNLHLATLIRTIPEKNLQRLCITGEQAPVTLEFLIKEYVTHLEHHLKQIVSYE